MKKASGRWLFCGALGLPVGNGSGGGQPVTRVEGATHS